MNDQPEGSVALLAAANAGESEFVAYLLDRGASITSHSITSAPVTNGEHIVDAADLAADRGRDELVKPLTMFLGGFEPSLHSFYAVSTSGVSIRIASTHSTSASAKN